VLPNAIAEGSIRKGILKDARACHIRAWRWRIAEGSIRKGILKDGHVAWLIIVALRLQRVRSARGF
jgi:hypothetical protein